MHRFLPIALTTMALMGFIGCHTGIVGRDELHFTTANPPRQIGVTNGPGFEQAWRTALRVQQIDSAMKAHPISDPAEIRLLSEARDESLRELEQGQYVAAHTSGSGSNPHFEQSNHWLDQVMKIIARGSAVRSNVHTYITVASVPEAALHFSTCESFNSGNPEWRSYNNGMVLEIRLYDFRVINGTNKPYDELIPVWDDPTTFQIVPMWRP